MEQRYRRQLDAIDMLREFLGGGGSVTRQLVKRAPFHRRGHTPAPHKEHVAVPHEARHIHCRPASDFPRSWNGKEGA